MPGLYFAPDPSSQKSCTIGGNVSENSGGPHTLAYGVTTNHVTGLELVLPDGEITRIGGKLGDALGYDLCGLLVGSEGTLSLVTEITAKLSKKSGSGKNIAGNFRNGRRRDGNCHRHDRAAPSPQRPAKCWMDGRCARSKTMCMRDFRAIVARCC